MITPASDNRGMPAAGRRRGADGFSLVELMAVVAIVGVLVTLSVIAASGSRSSSQKAACYAQKGDIEVQCELWRHDSGAWPATNLADIGADVSYFPAGVPVCPVNGSAYTIDTSGRIVGHSH